MIRLARCESPSVHAIYGRASPDVGPGSDRINGYPPLWFRDMRGYVCSFPLYV